MVKTRPGVIELFERTRRAGIADTGRRALRRLSERMDVESLDFPLLTEDIADSARMRARAGIEGHRGAGPLTVGWVCTPPKPGSGGHTTLFRMVEALEAAGHRCVIFLYDRHGGDLTRHAAVVREYWPAMKAEIRDATMGLAGADAYVASSWESAHVVAARATGQAALLYFIQDYEPFFHPHGTLYALAEDSYRFGFRNIALGELVSRHLTAAGVEHAVAPFGCDTDVYHLLGGAAPRSGVVYYTKPGSDRRGYLLGRLALEEFHSRHPEVPVHLYGDAVDDWTIPVVQHHRLSPTELNRLYNRTLAGLAISFTNITLVAEEMLAAGALPVVTEVPYARDVLPNPNVVWSPSTPGALADALSRAVEQSADVGSRALIAGSVRQGWGAAQAVVASEIAAAVMGRSADSAMLPAPGQS
ncbi:glycosyltransferase family 1 protein [Cryobacterium soli]|uniref:glycosyltransferase family 1 protein n=1 Tax=Cryobacterium soli TaxID=2220095 RepID=UPI000E70FD36|nr:glycosyltransferase family 1 protein [Cryobacterium soli]